MGSELLTLARAARESRENAPSPWTARGSASLTRSTRGRSAGRPSLARKALSLPAGDP